MISARRWRSWPEPCQLETLSCQPSHPAPHRARTWPPAVSTEVGLTPVHLGASAGEDAGHLDTSPAPAGCVWQSAASRRLQRDRGPAKAWERMAGCPAADRSRGGKPADGSLGYTRDSLPPVSWWQRPGHKQEGLASSREGKGE